MCVCVCVCVCVCGVVLCSVHSLRRWNSSFLAERLNLAVFLPYMETQYG